MITPVSIGRDRNPLLPAGPVLEIDACAGEHRDTTSPRPPDITAIVGLFARFTSPEVVRLAMSRPSASWKRPERRSATVLFADVRDFTPFVARVSPEEATVTVNAILGCIIEAIEAEGGIVNRFLGDGLLALFDGGPPTSHGSAAASGAIRARTAVELLAAERTPGGYEPLRIGIGINSGELVVCCIGTRKRSAFTVIGHPVNVAARLAATAGPGEILLGPGSVGLLHPRFVTVERPVMQLKGIGATAVVELLSERRDDVAPAFGTEVALRNGDVECRQAAEEDLRLPAGSVVRQP